MWVVRDANVASALLALALVVTLGACGGADGGEAGPDGGVGQDESDSGAGSGGDGDVDELCPAPGEVACDGTCCGDGEVCVDGACEVDCAGELCGGACCDGDAPICGPEGQCVPDCDAEGEGELCGDDLDECCPAGDACVYGECRTPGEACDSHVDCDFGEYCDDGLETCMPDDFPEGAACEIDYDFDPFEIDELWQWDGVELGDRHYENVQSIPVTADVVGGGTPEVVVTAYHGDDQHRAVLAVVRGDTGETLYVNDTRTFAGQGHAAVADVTGDGLLEIVVNLGEEDEGVALIDSPARCPDPDDDPDDCIVWDTRSGTLDEDMSGMGPLFADINEDGSAEVVVGTAVLDAETGAVIADGTTESRAHNGLDDTWGSAVVADLDPDDDGLELLTGDCAWKVDFENGELEEYWCTDEFSNGMPAVADIVRTEGRDGLPEVAVIRSGELHVLDGQDGEVLHSIDVPGGGDGGPPNIADFDGDGTVEIGLPGAECYSVFDLACLDGEGEAGECDQPTFPECTPGEPLPEGCPVDPCPGLEGGSGDGVLWSVEVQDGSMTTGSSVYDFQGNGRNEVVYNDECRLLVLDGQTGQPHISRINTTRTATEYPLVVDVNGDGRSNIAVIANNDQYDRDCEDFLDPDSSDRRPDRFPECFPEDPADRPAACDEGTSGVFAFEDVHDAWVRTRAIWNQHAYHITNIEDDGTLPSTWEPPWERFNTFRANRQGAVPLNAPDIAIRDLELNRDACPDALEIMATIENAGVSSIPADLPVTMYRADAGEPEPVETLTVDAPVSPGGAVSLTFRDDLEDVGPADEFDILVAANDDGTGEAPIFECNPDSASALLEDLRCGVVIE